MSWFWFPEAQFGSAKGVIRTRVGYAGGSKKNPTYYSLGEKLFIKLNSVTSLLPFFWILGDHTETVDIDYDPSVTSYSELLDMFWKNHDPTAKCKRQYMSAIFYHDEEQQKLAETTKSELSKTKKIATQILKAGDFTVAEE